MLMESFSQTFRHPYGVDRPWDRKGETVALLAVLAAAPVIDGLVAERMPFAVATGVTVAVLLRRPGLAILGFPAVFAGEAAIGLATAGAGAIILTACDVLLKVAVLAVLRSLVESAGRVRSGRALFEILTVTALGALLSAGLAHLAAALPVAAALDLDRFLDWQAQVLGGAIVMPIILLARRDGLGARIAAAAVLQFVVAAVTVALVAWAADRLFPFPYIVACIPILVAATRLPPVAVAVLGAECMVAMSLLASGHDDGHQAARAVAASLTGVLPTGLALVLAELRSERRRMVERGEQLRQVLSGIAGHGFSRLDCAGCVIGWDDKISAVTGYSDIQILGRPFATFFPAEERETGVPAALLATAHHRGRAERIGWLVRADATRYWASTSLEAIHDDRGHVIGFVHAVHDQSELQRSQSALMASERRSGFALGSAGNGVWEHDLATGTMHYSDVYTTMLGLAPGALGTDPEAWKTRVHPDDVARIPPDADGVEGVEVDLRLRHAEGRWIWVTDRRRVADRDARGRPRTILGTHTDVTARRLAEEKFRLAVEASPNGLLIADNHGRITLVNKETERMFGYEPGTLLGQTIDILVPEAHAASHAEQRAFYARQPTARRMEAGRDLNGRRRDGSLFPVEIGLNPITTTEGAQILCVVTDITARKIAEEKFRLAVEASPNGVLIVDRKGRISLVNSETERMFGYEPGTLLGQSVDVLVPQARAADHASHRAIYAIAPTARRMGAGRDLNGRRRDGSLVPVEIGLNPIMTAEGESVLCVVTDISARKQAEAELAFNEARYRSMADHFTDIVAQLDLDLTRTWISPACRDILGLEPETLLGAKPQDIVHPDDYDEVSQALMAVAGGQDRASCVARYRHADGHWIWLSISLRLVRGPDRAPVGILSVARDITRARAAEEQLLAREATFRGAMESASIGMALEEPNGRWVSVNRALCGILGRPESELVGCDRDADTHPDDVGLDTEQRRRLLAGEIASYRIDKRCLSRGGSIVWTQQSISLDKHPDGSPRRLIVQIQDITERKQIEMMKSEFVSMVSHELRTPLTSIRGALGLVLGAMAHDLPPRVVQLVDIAHKNSERLIPLVNDILDLDKIDAGMLRVDLSETDAAQLVAQAVEATRSYADRFGVDIALTLPPGAAIVHVDEGRFIQVVTNLLSNAAKFSPRGDHIDVIVAVADGRVRVSVRDRGPGIPEEFRTRIFGRFAQADSATTRANGGSGLGLHISRQLVSLMGGEIDFESVVGVGSTFWVGFPLLRSVAAPQVATTAAGQRQAIVLAHEVVFADFVAEAATAAGLAPRIVTAASALAGIEPGAAAVLVDAALPPEAARAFQSGLAALAGPPPPVFLITDGRAEPAESDGWSPTDVWRVDPTEPAPLIGRLAAVAAGEDGRLPQILHVEDDLDFAEVIATGLAGRAEVTRTARAGRALEALRTQAFDLVIIDPVLPDGDALALVAPHLERLGIPFLVLSADDPGELAEPALAQLIKSRVSETKLIETIIAVIAGHRQTDRETRHAG